ncbi:MAG TPA: DUF2268 domain-containing putative Zn-dependent protease [Saprospiraceae bacterium]|nr:DUF2268 domain-containing putative Zn-dependent protease [Saprospiraceae bacterium]
MKSLIFCLTFLVYNTSFGQTKVFTQDITNFFVAFDSIYKQPNKAEQLNIVQTIYIDKASNGLKDFISLGGGNTQKWLNYILYNKEYLMVMRPYLESISSQIPEIQSKLEDIKEIYPSFKDGNIYFIIGCGMVGGSPNKQTGNLILGAEVLVKKNAEWAVPAAIHEFIHIQQKDGNGQLLTQIVNEGVAEFLSEVFFKKDLAKNGFAPHLTYGIKNENDIWENFKKDMFVINNGFLGWLYGSKSFSGREVQDLGYFIGYKICKSYYDKTNNKNKSIQTLLELDLSSNEKIREFVLQSGYINDQDLDFVKSSPFTDKRITDKNKKVVFGYKIKKDNIIFEYNIPDEFSNRYKGNISVISVAGSFNNWNPENEKFVMVKHTNNSYKLTVPKSTIDLSIAQQFKFVINKDIWMPAPETAKNIDEKSQNLILNE